MSLNDTVVNFTPEQKAAINYRGGALLVSAAAGSGKTKVLIERLLSFVDEGVNIDEFLVITYTRAAAYELREKIYEELLNRLSKSPGNTRLRRQAMLCKGASIDTIHAFCSEILRENAHLVRLPPDFRVADESECTMIMNEVADKVLSGIYEKLEDYPGFTALIDTVADRRDDRLLVEALLTLYRKLQSLPLPEAWIKNQIEKQNNLTIITDISQTDFGEYMLKRIKSKISHCLAGFISLRSTMTKHTEYESKYAQSVDSVITQIYPLLSALDIGWDEARRHSFIEFPRPKPIKGHDKLKETRLYCIKELKKHLKELEYSSEEHLKDAQDISIAITALLRLVLDFDAEYAEEKRKKGVVDFSDLEHLTLSLLVDMETGVKKELARSISLRFKEVMIDEYQDVNAVQELIFNAISTDSGNIFMVGDVKQSIYRFRLADPTIFLYKYSEFTEIGTSQHPDTTMHGKKVHLSHNFRSDDGILKVVNHIFCNIMSKEFGELEYTDKEALVPGRRIVKGIQGKQGIQGNRLSETEKLAKGAAEAPEVTDVTGKGNIVEIDLIDMSTFGVEDDEESPTAIKIEAEYIAQKIKRLINERYQVPDDDGSERDITFSDIVILLRSVKGRAWQYAAALSEIDIPIEFPGGEGYFETTEVITALSLLAVIDNPIQDIPLASVMNSPLYNFTADELAELKLKSREKDLYSSIKESAERDIVSDETRVKCKKMLSDIDDLRIMSGDISSDRFIWNMYNRTGLLDLVSKMRGGEKRKGNLILLAESAKQFERSGYKGVYGFLRFIKNLQDRGIELTDRVNDKSTFPESYNSVKIMSIHKSKGLEFPIVILANTSKFNNFQDIRKNVVFHNELGLGVMLTDPTQRIRYSTLARTAIQNKLNDEMLSEELRVLYVAMTRAREKLIITATLKNTERTKEQLEEIPAGIVDPQAALALKSMIEWILVGIRGIEDAELSINYLDSGIIESIRNLASGAEKKIVPLPLTGVTYESDLSADSSRETISETDSRFSYPFKSSVDLPSKLTVTGLKALLDPEAELAPWVQKEKEKSAPVSSPLFISGNKELTAADQGTLMHLVLQHIDYKKSSHEHDNNRVAKELQRLSNIGFLTNEQIDKINIGKIKKLLSSTLGVRMTAAKMMEREFKFSILRPAEEFYPGGGTEKILLQGVVDCFFEEDNEIVVVDFKTNRVTEKNVDKIAQQYSQQLNTYADALHHITGKHVKEKIIYFFSIDHAYIL